MTGHPDILDQPEPLRRWLIGSLVLHLSMGALCVSFNVIGHQTLQLGDPHGGGIGSVQINPVATIPLPSRAAPPNPVANPTESAVPTPPPTKAKPTPKVKAPDPSAIALKSRTADKRPTPTYAEQNKFRAQQKDLPNQAYSSVGQAVSNPMYQMPGGGGVGVGSNSPFGSQFGEYANRLRDQVARNWKTNDIPPQIRTAPQVTITFTLHRDGTVSGVKISQRSGNAALDYSAQRAILDASPFPPLPQGFPKNETEIDFIFELKR